jgi:uncharacterized membrane protein YqjE
MAREGVKSDAMTDEGDGLGTGGKALAEDLRELVRLEIALARAEMATKARRAIVGLVLLVLAVLSALFLVAALVTAAILAVALAVPGWAAALVVTGLLALVAGEAALVGAKCLHSALPPFPKQAVETSKENIEWLKTRLRSAHK